ncbi:sensor histidine kinase [Kribbella capetownensis]|uniref:sensor histidine kinase n=1 Tax=Kribbella capetownensis TaxID=1572659 RepID=UPI0013F40AFA|nr:ATP-binding protein [Kribbella capetownensis]
MATARGVVEPRLGAEVIEGQRSALAAFDRAMRRYVLIGDLVRLKLWDAAGRIVYSDESRLIGSRIPLRADELEALWAGNRDRSGVGGLDRSESRFESTGPRLIEVHVPVRARTGEWLLFQTYFRYGRVVDASRNVLGTPARSVLGGLLAIALGSAPLTYVLLRRNQRLQRERLRRHEERAREAERRRLIGELHDGVVQDLAGVNYALERLRLGCVSPDQRGEVVADSAASLRRSIGTLRTLLIDSYPPDLGGQGLCSALTGLAERLERAGMEVQLEVSQAERLPPVTSALIFRAAQEAVRNVATHSGAHEVLIRAGRRGGQATLLVEDDGQGFDEALLRERRDAGHFGLRSTSDLMTACGGVLWVRATPGRGTRVKVQVPVG